MALFYREDEETIIPGRKQGFPRYREVLEGNLKSFFLTGFLTLITFIPFFAGMIYAVLSTSFLYAICAGVVGGLFAGPGMACLYDMILRRLRDDLDDMWYCWKNSFSNNFKASLLPGVVEFTFLGMLVFSSVMMFSGKMPFSWGDALLLFLSGLLLFMLFSIWWPQVVLFDQGVSAHLKNSVMFIFLHFWKVLGAALIRLVWWVMIFLFLPWSAFLVPILGIWYIQFLSIFMIYKKLDYDFDIEDKIREKFPGKLPEDE